MKRIFEVIATVGQWKDPASGKINKRTVAVGAIYESAGRKLVLRIDAIPVAPDWSGWMQLKPLSPEPPTDHSAPPGEPPTPEESRLAIEAGRDAQDIKSHTNPNNANPPAR